MITQDMFDRAMDLIASWDAAYARRMRQDLVFYADPTMTDVDGQFRKTTGMLTLRATMDRDNSLSEIAATMVHEAKHAFDDADGLLPPKDSYAHCVQGETQAYETELSFLSKVDTSSRIYRLLQDVQAQYGKPYADMVHSGYIISCLEAEMYGHAQNV